MINEKNSEDKNMSELTRIDFYCGSGIAILFRKNKNISPSFIEIVSDADGRKSSGIFYNFKTQNNNEAIIYIKCNSKIVSVKNMSECWKFSLSQTEKEKIQKQIEKGIPFFILLVCPNNFTKDDINGEAAILNIKDYEIISQRSDILIGLWNDNKKKRSFYIKNNKGNGLTEDYYFKIRRNLVETVSLDDLISEYYPDYAKNNLNNIDIKRKSNTENKNSIQNNFVKEKFLFNFRHYLWIIFFF